MPAWSEKKKQMTARAEYDLHLITRTPEQTFLVPFYTPSMGLGTTLHSTNWNSRLIATPGIEIGP